MPAGLSVLFATGVLLGGFAVYAPAQAHTGASFCEAEARIVYDPDHHDDAEAGCATGFQGWPIGVIGRYVADDVDGAEAPAEVHVDVFMVYGDGLRRQKIGECEAGNPRLGEAMTGKAECRFEKSALPADTPYTFPEPAPGEIARIECFGHSHAKSSGLLRFGCFSTNEAKAALEDDFAS